MLTNYEIEMYQNTIEMLSVEHETILKNVENELIQELKTYTQKDFRLRVSFSDYFYIKFDFLTVDEEGKTITDFASDFEIKYAYKHYRNENQRKLEVNHGTIGTYSIEENPFVVERVLVLAEIWKNRNYIIEILEKYYPELIEKSEKISNFSWTLRKDEMEKNEIERNKKKAEIAKQFVAGAVVSRKSDPEKPYFKIEKIMNKTMEVKYTYNESKYNDKTERYEYTGRTLFNGCTCKEKIENIMYKLIEGDLLFLNTENN